MADLKSSDTHSNSKSAPSEAPIELFESRKQDHIRISMQAAVQASGQTGLEKIQLIHEALPEINFEEITMTSKFFGKDVSAPYFISSMTAGHREAPKINTALVRAAARRGWPMGVGSQRRELTDSTAAEEWRQIRKISPQAILIGNLGIAQLIRSPISEVQRLADNLEADAFFIHCNALQECLQAEGNRQFRGGYQALSALVRELKIPVVVKETGCGFSQESLRRLRETGVAAIDVAGLGGTHWGRIEGLRQPPGHLLYEAARTFANWGVSTVQSVLWAHDLGCKEIWASGGVRNGLDAAKLLALGADRIGIAQPMLAAAIEGDEALDKVMERFEFELRVALFCTGHKHQDEWKEKRAWRWNSIENNVL